MWNLRAVRPPPRASAGAVVVVVAATGLPALDTDPGLLTYFAPDSEIRRGLDEIDADGGTSTLDLVVRDPDGRRVDQREVFARMTELQAALEGDSAVGVVLSPTAEIEGRNVDEILSNLIDQIEAPR